MINMKRDKIHMDIILKVKPNITTQEAMIRIERIRAALYSMNMEHSKKKLDCNAVREVS